MANEVSIKVLIRKSELQRLLQIEKDHAKCIQDSSSVVKSGSGNICSKPCTSRSGDLDNSYEFRPEDRCDDYLKASLPKEVIIQEAPIVPRQLSEQTNSPKLSDSVIISYLRKRYQVKGRKFLKKLHNSPKISYDSNGIVQINGAEIPGSSIFDLIAVCFYETKSKPIEGLTEWLKFLEQNGLMNFVENPSIKQNMSTKVESEQDNWWYLGSIAE